MSCSLERRALLLLQSIYRKADVNPVLQRIIAAGLSGDVQTLEGYEVLLKQTNLNLLYREGVEL